jgi:hypothetical protein
MMNADRRILTPVAASVLAGLVVAVATLGGSLHGERAAAKADRFTSIGDTLCAGQEWPNISNECLAWSEGEIIEASAVRYVTLAATDHAAGLTTLTRVKAADEAY